MFILNKISFRFLLSSEAFSNNRELLSTIDKSIDFPSHLSTVQVIRDRCGNDVVKLMRKFEKLDFKYRKVLLDLDFLDNCIRNNVAPKFVQFRVANKDLRNSSTYRQCQTKLLKQEISNKKRHARLLKKNLLSARNDLMCKLRWIDFNHVCNLFLLGNDKALQKSKIRSLVSYQKFLVKVSRMTKIKLSITFIVIN